MVVAGAVVVVASVVVVALEIKESVPVDTETLERKS